MNLNDCSISILCPNPHCNILRNRQIPFKALSTKDGDVELITDKCKNCGNVTRVIISLRADTANIKQYKSLKVNDHVPKSDTIHANICLSCVNYKIAILLYYPCDRCKRSMLWQGAGDDYYSMM